MEPDLAKQLQRCLRSIDRPLTFCTSRIPPTILPGLQVEGHGLITLPVASAEAKRLAAAGQQAPYGQGERTIVDRSVRRVTMFPPEQVRIDNPEWGSWLAELTDAVGEDLGLENRRLTARLHQLLLYRKGDFFLPHQDGEKLDGMVATMAVVLPSRCQEGHLVVRHAGREQRVAFDDPGQAYAIQVAAWYADCPHEIEPLAAGCRLVLIYNLVLQRPSQVLGAPDFDRETTTLARLLGRWADQAGAMTSRPRLVIPLQHAYSQRGLRPKRLKGNDAAQAQALFAAAAIADCRAYLAHLTYREAGEAISDYDGYYGSYTLDADQVEMGEIFDVELTAEHWTDAAGKAARFGVLAIDDEEVLGGVDKLKNEVSAQEFEGFTGNAGMELTRWYHRAAVVLWPAERHAEILCGGSLVAGIAGLTEAMTGLRKRPNDPERRQTARAFAAAVLNAWPDHGRWQFRLPGIEPGLMAALLAQLADTELIERYLTETLRNDLAEDPGAAVVDLAAASGWPTFLAAIATLFEQTTARSLERDTRLLALLCRHLPKNIAKTGRALAEQLRVALLHADPKRDGDYVFAAKFDRGAALQSLIIALHDLDGRKLMRALATAMDQDPQHFDLTQVQVPVALALGKRRKRLPAWPPFQRWLEGCHDGLAREIATPPPPPADWARTGVTSCDCHDCQALDQFLRDPQQDRTHFPLRKDRRQHLHRIIETELLDTTHLTKRTGSPHVLVCTKTDGSHQRACERYRTQVKLSKRLEKMLR